MLSTWPWTKLAHGEHRKKDAARRLLGGARAADGDERRRHAAHLLGDAELDLLAADLGHVGVVLGRRQAGLDPAEGDRVDVDLELTPLLGQRLGQADDAGLAGRVVGLAGVAHRAADRGDVDDLAEDLLAALALDLGRLAQVRGGRADDAEGRHQVDVEHLLKPVVAHLVDGRVQRVARVVDDDVDLAPGVEGRLDERLGRALRGQVSGVHRGLARDGVRRLLRGVTVEVVDDDLGAVLGQQLRRCLADAARAAGDDRHLVVEDSHARLLVGLSGSRRSYWLTGQSVGTTGCRAAGP